MSVPTPSPAATPARPTPEAPSLITAGSGDALTAQDLCDRCPGQAFLRFEHPTKPGQILMCRHHGTEHADALASGGFLATTDQTHLLFERPGISD